MKVINFAASSDDPSYLMDELCSSIRYMLENNVFGSLKTESIIVSTLQERRWLNSPERVAEIESRLSDNTKFLSVLHRHVKYASNIPQERRNAYYGEYLNYEAAERLSVEPVSIGDKVFSPERLAMLKSEKERNRLEKNSEQKILRSEAPPNPFADKIARMIKERKDSYPSMTEPASVKREGGRLTL
ncbi:hypothetical protein [Vibrio sp. D431a]|uniref:hypothetical protein n=1 Tax=Vibrio sp. D431a TaxID=2837388 RepID=UPI002552BE3F|nr:hypothetical protein [Vibrio sp. D431a]MDK9790029.1 hypothetical protein [Vibrio sp. D431a]